MNSQIVASVVAITGCVVSFLVGAAIFRILSQSAYNRLIETIEREHASILASRDSIDSLLNQQRDLYEKFLGLILEETKYRERFLDRQERLVREIRFNSGQIGEAEVDFWERVLLDREAERDIAHNLYSIVEVSRSHNMHVTELLKEISDQLRDVNTGIGRLDRVFSRPIMDPQLIANWMAAGQTALTAASLWLQSRSEKQLREALEKESNSSDFYEEAQTLALLIPKETFQILMSNTEACFTKYNDVAGKPESFLPSEQDDAAQALINCVCRWLSRLQKINGDIPEGQLLDWWTAYKCRERQL
ncbi:hypothetical protein IQ258_23820 [Coleofasciculus sp. LEGE 07081]|uniref:hypothetical protein n=1 Tax=Coleofasciculus sp. LEGE 07081 TaxID=2777967 RepID=UPI0018801235|nr:hypothetical protein [Coleofasciculus sp. LEGE 07081]MBE9129096.1 hypothetical protein [Coleofasciculus sp. LEGE 07081]